MVEDTELLYPIIMGGKYLRNLEIDKMYELNSIKSDTRKRSTKEEYINSLKPLLEKGKKIISIPIHAEIIEKKFDKTNSKALIKVRYGYEINNNNSRYGLKYEYFILVLEDGSWKILEKSENPLEIEDGE